MADGNTSEFLIEFRQIGSYVKVSAIDPVSMQEVSIVGVASLGQEELGRLAVRKLKYVLNKRRVGGGDGGDRTPSKPSSGGGQLV